MNTTVRPRTWIAALISLETLACAAVCTAVAGAQIAYYTAPHIIKRADPTTPVGGKGTVVVKVLVNPDGSAKVQGILRSTNHADDAAALEIARTSTYAPAKKGNTAVLGFYDYTLSFNASGHAAAPAGSLASIQALMRANKYADAKTALTSYVQAHPDDQKAYLDLALANVFLADYTGAADAFDKTTSVPSEYKTAAAKAYAEAATKAVSEKNYTPATAYAKKAVQFGPSVSTYDLLGFAEFEAGDFANSTADLERARAMAAPTSKIRGQIDANLVQSYLGAGDIDKARTIAAEAHQIDPSDVNSENAIAGYYAKNAAAKETAGDYAGAATLYEQGADASPSNAAMLYSRAALANQNVAKPDAAKVKADADKAIAADPQSAYANFAAGIAAADAGKKDDALKFLNKADGIAKNGSNASLTAAIEKALKDISSQH